MHTDNPQLNINVSWMIASDLVTKEGTERKGMTL